MAQEHRDLILTRLNDIGDPQAVRTFFDLLHGLIQSLAIGPDDPRLALNVRNEPSRRRISVNLNGRLVLGLQTLPRQSELMFALYEQDFQALVSTLPDLARRGEKFRDETPQAMMSTVAVCDFLNHDTGALLAAWQRHNAAYLPRQQASQYRKHHMPLLYEMAEDAAVFREIMHSAANETSHPAMNHPTTLAAPASFADLIARYKEKIREDANAPERYKWTCLQHFQDTWKTDAADFGAMLKDALSKQDNLFYQNSIGFITKTAQHFPEETRRMFRGLYDETQALEARMADFRQQAEALRERLKAALGKNMNHQQDERTLSFYLGMRYPGRYPLYKQNVYEKAITVAGETKAKTGEKYSHYLELGYRLMPQIVEDAELQELVAGTLQPGDWQGPQQWLIFQDILYRNMRDRAADPSFNDTIAAVQEYLREIGEAERFVFGKKKSKDWIWVGDAQDLVGTLSAHYEISLGRGGKEPTRYFVDVHFEGGKKQNAVFGEAIRDALPEGFEWMDWLKKERAIFLTNGIPQDAEDLPEQIAETLLTVERGLGNRLRDIIRQTAPPVTPPKNDKPHPLNQILYGPPGTGKTFGSINHALAIATGTRVEHWEEQSKTAEGRKAVKQRFDELYIRDWNDPGGQIAFVTFHQSLGYEDFIEGIKPVQPASGDSFLKYEIRDGVFKRLCVIAHRHGAERFDDAFQRLIAESSEAENNLLKLETATGAAFGISTHNEEVFNLHTGEKLLPQGKIYKRALMRYIGGDSTPLKGWLGYADAILNRMKSSPSKNFVLIIDEINRGNVSQIFGELITLLEEGKRAGHAEALSATLPYSREVFSVPPNLHIIGTMNTADRSVEALDTALRRRFHFVHKGPQPELLDTDVEGINLRGLLTKINERLEVLIDADHTIGHAWLMGCGSAAEVAAKFEASILPLLREYFYNDYGKIGLVLGERFVSKAEEKAKAAFAHFKALDGDVKRELQSRPMYTVAVPAEDRIAAFQSIYAPAS